MSIYLPVMVSFKQLFLTLTSDIDFKIV